VALERVAEQQASQALGLPVQLGDVDLWVILGGLELEDVRIARVGTPLETEEVDPETAFFRIGRVYVRLGWLDFLRREVRLREVEVQAPVVRIEADERGRMLLPSPPPSEPAAGAPAAEEPGTQWGFRVDRLQLLGPEARLVPREPGAAAPFEFTLEEFTFDDLSFLQGELGLGTIGIRGPKLRVQRSFAVGGAAPGAAEPTAAPAPAEPAAGAATPAFRVRQVAIERAAFTLLTEATALDVALRLSARDISAAPNATFPLELTLEIEQGVIETKGRIGLAPPSFDGRLEWRALPLSRLALAAEPELGTWLRGGSSEGELDVRFAPAADPATGAPAGLKLAGRVRLADLAVSDEPGDESVGWRDFEIGIEEVRLPLGASAAADAGRIALGKVRLDAPVVRVTLPLDSLAAFTGPPAPAAQGEEAAAAEPSSPPAAPAAATGPAIALGELELRGGELHFVDRTIAPEYRSSLRDLVIEASGVRWPERDVKRLHLRARGAGGGILKFDGSLARGDGKISLVLDKLLLPPFTPYAASAAGYRLERGDLSLKTGLTLRGERFDAKNELVLHELSLSSQDEGGFESRFGMPLNVGLAVLRDASGNIALSVPMSGERSGLRVGLGTLLLSAFRAALMGAISSPLKAFGGVVSAVGGANQLSIEPLPALPGRATLAEGQEPRLTALADLLAARPALALELRGRTGPLDRPGVAEQMLIERVLADESLPPLEGVGFFARRRITGALEERGRGKEGRLDGEDAQALERWVAGVEVPAERLSALARARAEQLRERLVREHSADAARLLVADPLDGEPAVVIGLAVKP
jgi:hypothetical protein